VSKRLTIAIDAMGGDHAPGMVVAGCDLARTRFPQVDFVLFGDSAAIEPLFRMRPKLQAVTRVVHTEIVVANDEKPSVALRTGRESSMRKAIDLVAAGEADCVVSAGNTGALMAMAKFVLKTLPGIHRPAIASFFPTLRGETVMLDLGANIQCDADNLVQFAVMGEVFARTVLGLTQPSVALLNVGTEEVKGNDSVRQAAAILRESGLPIDFKGFIEGDGIPAGTVDVVVTDGFTGNVALKTAEGTARLYTEFMRRAFRHSIQAKIGYLFSRSAFNKLRTRTDPRRYNGAMFLGLNGICVKSHGGTDAQGFANALGVAVDVIEQRLLEKIRNDFERIAPPQSPDQEAAAM